MPHIYTTRTGLAYGRHPELRETARRLAVTTAPRLAATNRQDRRLTVATGPLLAKPGLAEGPATNAMIGEDRLQAHQTFEPNDCL